MRHFLKHLVCNSKKHFFKHFGDTTNHGILWKLRKYKTSKKTKLILYHVNNTNQPIEIEEKPKTTKKLCGQHKEHTYMGWCLFGSVKELTWFEVIKMINNKIKWWKTKIKWWKLKQIEETS